MNDRHLASGRDLHRLAGKETPATAIFHKGISEAKLGVEGLAAGNPFCVGDAGHDSGIAVYPRLHVVVLKNLVFRIAFFRFGEIIGPRAYLSPGVDQDVILHHALFDAGGIAVLVAEREFVFRAQNIIFISSLE